MGFLATSKVEDGKILTPILNKYMILIPNGEYQFVKEYDFFVSQGGLKEPWGRNWIPMEADSIEGARLKARKIWETERNST